MILGNNSSVDANGFWEGMVIKKHNREIFMEGTSTISRKKERKNPIHYQLSMRGIHGLMGSAGKSLFMIWNLSRTSETYFIGT